METSVEKKGLAALLFEAFGAANLSGQPARRRAMELVLSKGLPNARTEEYRFTPVARALEGCFAITTPAAPAIIPSLDWFPEMACNRVVFINGKYFKEHSRIIDAGLSVSFSELPAAKAELDTFDLLNLCFASEAVHLEVGNGVEVKNPVAIVHCIANEEFVFANPRWTLSAGEGSKVTILEYAVIQTGKPTFNNNRSLIEAGKDSSIDYVTIQQGGREEIMVNNALIRLADGAQAQCYTVTLEGKLIRNNLTLQLDGEGIDAHLHGLYLASGNNMVDNHTVVDHRKPNSFSNELYKGVMDGNGKAVFNGKIFVRPDAQKTNAFQSNRNLLLSESANVHAKPQLEIWADDVKCSHGCTTGQLDEEALFYLRSRGISKDTARGMLLTAFCSETLEGIRHEGIRSYVESLILKKLHPEEA
jgi:Fe-S cluster assembly protein SufD